MRRALTYTRTDVESVLDSLEAEDAAAQEAAGALFDEGLVAVVEDEALGGRAIGFALPDPAAAAAVDTTSVRLRPSRRSRKPPSLPYQACRSRRERCARRPRRRWRWPSCSCRSGELNRWRERTTDSSFCLA